MLVRDDANLSLVRVIPTIDWFKWKASLKWLKLADHYPLLHVDFGKLRLKLASYIVYLFAQSWTSECPDVKKYKWRLNPVWHRMLYSCTYMATVGVKGLMVFMFFLCAVSRINKWNEICRTTSFKNTLTLHSSCTMLVAFHNITHIFLNT